MDDSTTSQDLNLKQKLKSEKKNSQIIFHRQYSLSLIGMRCRFLHTFSSSPHGLRIRSGGSGHAWAVHDTCPQAI